MLGNEVIARYTPLELEVGLLFYSFPFFRRSIRRASALPLYHATIGPQRVPGILNRCPLTP